MARKKFFTARAMNAPTCGRGIHYEHRILIVTSPADSGEIIH
jgi:hypothetical protein